MKLILFIMIGFSLLQAGFTRSNEVVYDDSTGLYWQDNADAQNITRTWQGAIEYCEGLSLASQEDWRLPNKNELLSIVDYARYNPSMDSAAFQNITSSIDWSSTSYAYYTDRAWSVNFNYGYTGNYGKAINGAVRCVRGGQ